ncbi:chorismate mutase [Streptomyces sp. NBC_00659]|uniref:chorismate mutase n=1 Tax=Streptomyces sp. NBC_00659 TaxID=2903669 RepID=UPI002E2F4C8C|nr:chorismate mutase [Streptomyces sp. NBC_00659]
MKLPIQGTEAPPGDVELSDSDRRFAYLGPAGTFTEQALHSIREARGSRLLSAATASEALAYVCRGIADATMLPVHNTVAGMVPDTLCALVESPSLIVVREVVLGVEFALLARPGTPLSEVRTVSGHPHARTQVRRWLNNHVPQARWIPAPSNAEGARSVRDGECDAAVAGEFAAARYGLEPTATGIQDAAGATTRFLLCARRGTLRAQDPDAANRTSLIGRIAGRPSRVEEFLGELKSHRFLHGVSLSVVRHGSDSSVLFVDCPGRMDQRETARAVGLLQLRLPGLRSMGSYASALPVISPSERSRTVNSKGITGADASVEPASGDIAQLREQIDALDHSLIGTLQQRLEASREIQRLRTGGGGSRVDSGREHTVRGRYTETLGKGGSEVADAVLEMCRGRVPQ